MSSAYNRGFTALYTPPMKSMGGCTSISFLKQCEGYSESRMGNVFAAKRLFEKCVKQEYVDCIRKNYQDSILLPVLSHDNALPLAFAMHIGLPVWPNVRNIQEKSRKQMNAMQRILNSPTFEGYVQPNRSYVLVDDIVTQGGTIMALRKFVTDSGGHVDAAIAIAYAKFGKTIIPTIENIDKFSARFGGCISDLFRELKIPFRYDCLSNSQILYLLRFSSIEKLFIKAVEAMNEN